MTATIVRRSLPRVVPAEPGKVVLAPFRRKEKAEKRPQNYRTPRALFRELELRFGRGRFDIDVAADALNTLCARFYDETDDALRDDRPWCGSVFCNPPFESIRPWVEKAKREVDAGRAEVVVLLLPNRRGAAWYHEVVKPFASRAEDIKGRVRYEAPPGIPNTRRPFENSLVVVFERPLIAAELCRSCRA